jgi:predicted Zn-dependent protease
MKIKRLIRSLLEAAIGIAAVATFSSCATVDAVTGQNVYNLYSVEEDIKLGQSAKAANLQEIQKAGIPLNADRSRSAQIDEITQRIAAVSDMPHLPYVTTLVHTSIVNACAFPGGQMMVFEGLYCPKNGLVKDEDELAAVIAHEIAHVNCRHSTERLSKIMTAGLIVEVAAAVADHKDKDDVAAVIRAAFAVGTALWIPVHSRTDEFEADRVGLFYMARAGYDPRAAPRIWKRVAEREGDKWGLMSIFATHPANKARYEALEKMLPYAMEEYVAVIGEYPKGYAMPAEAPAPGSFDWRRPPK